MAGNPEFTMLHKTYIALLDGSASFDTCPHWCWIQLVNAATQLEEELMRQAESTQDEQERGDLYDTVAVVRPILRELRAQQFNKK